MTAHESPATADADEAARFWQTICDEVQSESQRERLLTSFLHATVLNHDRIEDALSYHLSEKLSSATLPAMALREVLDEGMRESADIGNAARADLCAIRERDPACSQYWVPLLYYKGFHALVGYRIAHAYYSLGRRSLALHLQNRISEVFGVDIHPAARIGRGIFVDHATSVVIGETSVVEDDVSMLHEVTLGGTGKETGDRHPKVRRGVLICAGAKILGNVEVGEGAKVAAGSVVLTDVPAHCTVAGVPAEVVGRPKVDQPSREMDVRLSWDI
jgi:serine O-acetyltransferase